MAPDLTGELLRLFLETLDRAPEMPVPPRFLASLDRDLPARQLDPHPLPCLRHLVRVERIAIEAARPLAGFLLHQAPALAWQRTYTAAEVGSAFLDAYGWIEVVGTRGHFRSDRVAAGLLLLGPRTLYPDHRHEAEEIYVPLTGGTAWRMGGAAFGLRAGGEVIHHASNVPHAMRTRAEPLLALYVWRGGPLAQRSVMDGVSS